jgi:hypothetical protein
MDSQSSIIYRPSSVFTLYFRRDSSTNVERTLQIRPFYAKQTQFSGLQNDVNSAYTKDYEDNRRKLVMKKQTQFKANLSQNKPNLSQFQTGRLLINRMKLKLLNFLPNFSDVVLSTCLDNEHKKQEIFIDNHRHKKAKTRQNRILG